MNYLYYCCRWRTITQQTLLAQKIAAKLIPRIENVTLSLTSSIFYYIPCFIIRLNVRAHATFHITTNILKFSSLQIANFPFSSTPKIPSVFASLSHKNLGSLPYLCTTLTQEPWQLAICISAFIFAMITNLLIS